MGQTAPSAIFQMIQNREFTHVGCATIQRNIDRLNKWAEGNLLKLNKVKCNIQYLGKK